MIPALAEYLAYEAMTMGATPEIRATFLPFVWPNGVDAEGDFTHCAFVTSDRIQADYEGFTGGLWVSEVVAVDLQVPTSPAVLTYNWNYPGYTGALFYRGAVSAEILADMDWTAVESGDSILIYPFYQFKFTLEGYRAWVVDAEGGADEFTAYAVDADPDEYLSYAGDDRIAGDGLTYIETLELQGEYTITQDQDIEIAGSLSMEVPTAFDDLVAGDHSGLTLNNRQGSFVDSTWVPAPAYSPNKSSFFLAGQANWYDVQLRIELGWSKGGWFQSGFGEGAWLGEDFTEFITLFLGKIVSWGPLTRAVDQDGMLSPNTVEIYAQDWIYNCLQKRVALPNADGTPNPLTYGEFLMPAERLSGWSPEPPIRTANFAVEDGYHELDHKVELGGGAVSLETDTEGNRVFRTKVTGANQSAYGSIVLPSGGTGEFLITGFMRFTESPTVPYNVNFAPFHVIDQSGATEAEFWCNIAYTGGLYFSPLDENQLGNFSMLAYRDIPIPFAFWIFPHSYGWVKFWMNGDEDVKYFSDLHTIHPSEIRFGAMIGAVAENWTIDWSEIKVYQKYYDNAFQVSGGPFESIPQVYVDGIAQPAYQAVGEFGQYMTLYPQTGVVWFWSTDPDFSMSGEVMVRVVKDAGGVHPLAVIEDLLDQAGLTSYVDAPALAAAYAATPNDIIHARFEGGAPNKQGLKDTASLGIPIADCLKEICARCLYWIFVDAGKIKIVPYTGTPPTAPLIALTNTNLRECTQTIDLSELNTFVSAVYGWYDHNPALHYVAGNEGAGDQGGSIDFSWSSPVVSESRIMAKEKADLLLKYLNAKEIIDPARLNLSGARLELMDSVSVSDPMLHDTTTNYFVVSKEVGLDPGSRETSLQLIRFLGEIT